MPQYRDAEESDTFILSGAEDLVPALVEDEEGSWERDVFPRTPDSDTYTVQRYRPRIEGLFARIERWQQRADGDVHWRSITRDNVASIYGRSSESRIADPDDESRIFQWLLEESRDDKGNIIAYEYKQEDAANIDPSLLSERNRLASENGHGNRYLKRIRYGNTKSFEPGNWLFEVVFDYGEHDEGEPTPDGEVRSWPVRSDPFSSFRAGFEIRTQRLCRRVLMFHNFEELGDGPCLVRSTDFTYEQSPTVSYLASVSQTGYRRSETGYVSKSLPPLEFTYTQAEVDKTIHYIDAESLENLPIGLDGAHYHFVDLDGEGIAGILTEQGTGWFYKRNLGGHRFDLPEVVGERLPSPPTLQPPDAVRFAPAQLVASKPSIGNLQVGQQQIMDLAGDGQKDLVLLGTAVVGFYERDDGQWVSFKPFQLSPSVNWSDPNLRLIDLNGDGQSDILVSNNEVFVWYQSQGEEGFGPSEQVRKLDDEEQGPAVVFADASQSIHLADMNGDGLVDIVRLRNDEVCYWPSMGHARFGAKVTMDSAPSFDVADQFSQSRIRLADIDGSGTTDIIYLGNGKVNLHLNQAGNSWSAPEQLADFPATDNLTSVMVADLMGNGTACLVWSSPLPSADGQPACYVDLMGGQKPHLLSSVTNNLGAETRLHYAPSTKYYLEDFAAGRPWITKLPFPVHVVERVEVCEHVTQTKLVTLYRYHHGYYDGEEREFRGFGLVEQWDTEFFPQFKGAGLFTSTPAVEGEEFHLPPVYTKTWFHTGAYVDREHISRQYIEEYYDGDPQALLLPDTILPPDLSTQEEREACRALKGRVLHQEIYALDDDPGKSKHPYTVTETNYLIKQIQPKRSQPHGVFYAHEREILSYHYERNPGDPRIGHTMTLEADNYGNVTKSVAIGYPRRDPAYPEQRQTLMTYTEADFFNLPDQKPDEVAWYRVGVPVATKTYEVTGVERVDSSEVYSLDDLPGDTRDAEEIPYEATPEDGTPQKRLIECVRSLYYKDDLSGPAPLGQVPSLALPYETCRLAFTPGLLKAVYGERVGDELLDDEARYLKGAAYKSLHLFPETDDDGVWWLPSGRSVYPESPQARTHFYLPSGFQDPFEQTTKVTYDDYDVLPVTTEGPLRNVVQARNNYRTMQPWEITDANRNRSQVAFDALGMVVGTATMGKAGEAEGDSLQGFLPDLTETTITGHVDGPLDNPHAVLGRATTRLVYDVGRYQRTREVHPDGVEAGQPVVVYTLARETHDADLAEGEKTKVQHSFLCSDGLGREIQTKIQAEPGPTPVRDLDTGHVVMEAGKPKMTEADTDPRWAGTGRTVYDNKANPIKQYEPFFSHTHLYEDDNTLVNWGVTPTLRYDPLGRLIRTDNPNGTFSRMEFDAWRQTTSDENDTVLESEWYVERGSPNPEASEIPSDPDKRAAYLAAQHADTPAVQHMDVLGRPFLSIARNREIIRNDLGEIIEVKEYDVPTHTRLDIEGSPLVITDARGNRAMEYLVHHLDDHGDEVLTTGYDVLGRQLYQASMDAGECWTLNNVSGNPIRAWDSRRFLRRMTYDALRRPTGLYVTENGVERLAERTVYGEGEGDAANHRTRVHQLFDGAGIVTSVAYDFKGNLLEGRRDLLPTYKQAVDWQQNPAADDGTFTNRTTYDALNRPLTATSPDGSVYRPSFNEANLLDKVDVNLRGAAAATPFVININYNAKGQRKLIEYGCGAGPNLRGVTTTYEYDEDTFRITHLKTTRPAGLNGPASRIFTDSTVVQDLRYAYDPVGNITRIEDAALKIVSHGNQQVAPVNDYTYDAIYRLFQAHGREHIGQTAHNFNPADGNRRDHPFAGLTNFIAHPNDTQKLRHYTEHYEYDAVGNFELMRRTATNGNWTQRYEYEEDSLIEAGKQSNRLTRTKVGNGLNHTETYTYADAQGNDVHGCMTTINSMAMLWDFKDQLQQVDLNGGGMAYYVYSAAGQRVRKVIERQNSTKQKERIYLGGFEVYREYDGASGAPNLERETLHIMDDKQRIALVETRTDTLSPEQLIRYQFGNHLGSASLELDKDGALITYEEYHPYGTTAFQAGRSAAEVSMKRYRYIGKERDEESGLYYHGARYYAPWLGRWASCDPAGLAESTNLYTYTLNQPITRVDITGYQSDEPKVAKAQAASKPIKIHNATGKTLEQQWRSYFESQPDVEKVIKHSRLKDPVTKKGIGSGKGTGPKDLAVIWKITKEATIVEVSTEKEFAKAEVNPTSRKAFQAKHTQETLRRKGGALVGDKKVGYYKATASWKAKGSPSPEQTYEIPGRPTPEPTAQRPAARAARPKVQVGPRTVSPRLGPGIVELDPRPSGVGYGIIAAEVMHDVAESAHVTRDYESWGTTLKRGPGFALARFSYEVVEGARMTPGLLWEGVKGLGRLLGKGAVASIEARMQLIEEHKRAGVYEALDWKAMP